MVDLYKELAPRLVDTLACPVCGASMAVSADGHSLVCNPSAAARPHCFDAGAAGYLSLAPRHPGGGDAKEAVRARTAFLEVGYYAPAAEAIAAVVRDITPVGGRVLDAGCGDGYYTAQFAADGYDVMGVDLSKFATLAAAKRARADRQSIGAPDSHTLFAVGSVFDLPVQDGCFDTVTNIFAPCAPAEYARVLKPGGILIVAGAGERHLLGLKSILYDDPYLNDPRRDLPTEADGFEPVTVHRVAFTITVRGREAIAALFSMTPYYWRTPRESGERLAALETLTTEVAFDIHVYKKTQV